MIRQMSAPVHVGFVGCEAQKSIRGIDFPNCDGPEWALWTALVEAGIDARQLPPAQIKVLAMSQRARAKTDCIGAELIARFMRFRPEAGPTLPSDNLRILRALTTRRVQIVDMRKRLSAQIAACQKKGIPADVKGLDDAFKAMFDTRIGDL